MRWDWPSAAPQVVVNDFGGARDGEGHDMGPADEVVAEIKTLGGDALAHGTSVTDEAGVADMVGRAVAKWGRVDILVANAGVLRDKTFTKMTVEDFRFVVETHLMGTVICAKAVWDGMRERNYGRIVVTTSSSGLYRATSASRTTALPSMGLRGPDADAETRRPEERHPRQRAGAGRGHTHDRRHLPAGAAATSSTPRK